MRKASVLIPVTMRETAAILVSRAHQPIVVNSFGRSGSTVLFDAVSSSAARFGALSEEKVVRSSAWKLDSDRVRRGRVYKSHDYPMPSLPADTRVLYVFGSPEDATLSLIERARVSGQQWLDEHADHLRVPHFAPEDLLQSDVLRIADHLRAWLSQEIVATGFVRYETMWDHQKEISDFVGFSVSLPKRRERQTKEGGSADDLRMVYADAIRLVDSLPDWSIRNPG